MRAGSRLPPTRAMAKIPPEGNAAHRDQDGQADFQHQRSTVLDNIAN